MVLIDPVCLGTLPLREVRAGYAEVVKYGLIDDPDFFDWCEANGAALLDGDQLHTAKVPSTPEDQSRGVIEAVEEVLRRGEAGELFRNGDAAGLAAAAGRLLDQPERRAELSAAASAAVREYDWPVVARDVVRVYEAVVPGAGRVEVAP